MPWREDRRWVAKKFLFLCKSTNLLQQNSYWNDAIFFWCGANHQKIFVADFPLF
jgi:hypothetical protein